MKNSKKNIYNEKIYNDNDKKSHASKYGAMSEVFFENLVLVSLCHLILISSNTYRSNISALYGEQSPRESQISRAQKNCISDRCIIFNKHAKFQYNHLS